jgi:pyrroloquinoline-quinone synthase
MNERELLGRIDEAIEGRNLLKHPFYRDWQAGTLTRAKLQFYAAQYYKHVEAFPVHLRTLAVRASGTLRELILENLAEEEDPVAPHPRLWRDFAAAVGVKPEALWTSAPIPGMNALIETYRQTCRERPFEEAVAALYAYEAQVPEIAQTKMEGLRRHYGVHSAEGLEYFRVHEAVDRVHRAAWRGWLEERAETHAAEQVMRSAESVLDALWKSLDGIQEAPC